MSLVMKYFLHSIHPLFLHSWKPQANTEFQVPFYQPLAALELFERAVMGKDIATGKVKPGGDYITRGTAKSEFREGNSMLQLQVLPENATFPPPPPTLKSRSAVKKSRKRGGRRLRL
jgi:hypothetical protein